MLLTNHLNDRTGALYLITETVTDMDKGYKIYGRMQYPSGLMVEDTHIYVGKMAAVRKMEYSDKFAKHGKL